MTGLELSRLYFMEEVFPAFSSRVPGDMASLCFGLAGPGSECLGFDDEISRDHDWGPRVCIWVPEDLYRNRGAALQCVYDSLSGSFRDYPAVRHLESNGNPTSVTKIQRDGIISISRFLRSYLGTDRIPRSDDEWMALPEEGLSLCISGAVFRDGPGEFSAIRQSLGAYYPDRVRLKKAARLCLSAGRLGQYDLGRALMRRDRAAAECTRAAFARDIAALGHLTRRKFRPYDKWLFRSLADSDVSGRNLARRISTLWYSDHPSALKASIDACVSGVIDDMKSHGLPVAGGKYLYDIGQVMGGE